MCMMEKEANFSNSLKRIIAIFIILILSMGIAVVATKEEVKNITVKFPDGTNLLLSSSKEDVKEILEDNNIMLLDNEDIRYEKLSNNNVIIIENKDKKIVKEDVIPKIEKEHIVDNYENVVEKIEVEEIKIPYETITRTAEGYTEKNGQNRVIQEGKDGIKEIKHRVLYKNNELVEKTKISEEIIKKPVNKIIQLAPKYTSRGGSLLSRSGNTWSYDAEGMRLLYAVTMQEGGGSYQGALAVISSACNRAESRRWGYLGRDPLSQYKAKGQYSYSIDNHWRKYYNNPASVPGHVKQAVNDALNGTRNHHYTSFRSAWTGRSGVNIGGNVYFGPK